MMKKDLKISCIIPLYNDEKYIERCIKSLINQTFYNIEIIIINDGSTDDSEKICKKIQQKDKRVKLISTTNKGVCCARNTGIKNFTGDYAIFVDSDDFLELNAIESFCDVIEEQEPDLIVYDYKRVFENGKYKDVFSNTGKVTCFTGKEVSKLYLKKDPKFSMVLWRRVYKKSLLKTIEFEENVLPEDFATAFYIYSMSKKVCHLEKSFYNYFIKNDGLSFQNTLQDQKNLYKIIKKLTIDEKKYFNEEMDLCINNIYFKYLLTIFSKSYFLKDKEKLDFLMLIENEIKDNYSNALSCSCKIAYCIFRCNKKLFSLLLNYKNYINIRKR